MIVTFCPLGVPREYSWKGRSPTGSTCSNCAPAVGRLTDAYFPPLAFSQVQTSGGV